MAELFETISCKFAGVIQDSLNKALMALDSVDHPGEVWVDRVKLGGQSGLLLIGPKDYRCLIATWGQDGASRLYYGESASFDLSSGHPLPGRTRDKVFPETDALVKDVISWLFTGKVTGVEKFDANFHAEE